MPGAPANSILEVTVELDVNDQLVESVLHYVVDAQSDLADPIADQSAIVNLIGVGDTFDLLTPWAACLSTSALITTTRVQYILPTRYRATVASEALAGTRTGVCTAQNVAAVITRFTPLAGRSQIGAVHLGGISASDYSGGTLVAGLTTAMVTLKNALDVQLAQDLGPGLWTPCLYHRGKTGTAAFTRITGGFVQSTLRTMRRRTVGRGI